MNEEAVMWKWTGNLRDDCKAVGNGLMLCAVMMDRGHWWWGVYDNDGRMGSNEIAVSHDEPAPYHARTGKEARAMAEDAANEYLNDEADRGWS